MSTAPAAADCELIGQGLLSQPANAVSSLAFVLVGALLLQRRPVLGWASIGVGLGSFVFHGPMPAWAEWAHDVSLAVLVVALVLEERPRLLAAAGTILGVGFVLWPATAEGVTVGLVAIAAVTLGLRLRREHLPRLVLPAGLVVVGATVAITTRSDGLLCSPESILQGHAAWHVLGASAIWAWARYGDSLVHR